MLKEGNYHPPQLFSTSQGRCRQGEARYWGLTLILAHGRRHVTHSSSVTVTENHTQQRESKNRTRKIAEYDKLSSNTWKWEQRQIFCVYRVSCTKIHEDPHEGKRIHQGYIIHQEYIRDTFFLSLGCHLCCKIERYTRIRTNTKECTRDTPLLQAVTRLLHLITPENPLFSAPLLSSLSFTTD